MYSRIAGPKHDIYKSIDTLIMSAQKLFVDIHTIYALLGKLERGKENGVDNARPRHGDTQTCRVSCEVWIIWVRRTSVHPWIQELDLRSRLLVFAANKTIALIYTLGSVDREDLIAD